MTTLNLDLKNRVKPTSNEVYYSDKTDPIGSPNNSYPVPFHYTFDIIDSSKLSTYCQCPRQFFYKYILGWTKLGTHHDLNFGTAIHESMLVFNQWRQANLHQPLIGNEAVLKEAFVEFLIEYRKEHPKEFDNDYRPKDPATANHALVSYLQKYDVNDTSEIILHPETGGSVIIDELGRKLHFKMDVIIEDRDGNIIIRDYKTGSRKSQPWEDKFYTSFQIGTYLHAAKCLYGNRVKHFNIRGIFTYKANSKDREFGCVDFHDVYVMKNSNFMEEWRIDICHWYDMLENDMNELKESKESDIIMSCFRKNPEFCTKFRTCQYFEQCCDWTNPLAMQHELPMGYRISRWDPIEKFDGNEVIL